MDSSTAYLLAADIILLLHVLIVAFVVIGLALIFVGKTRSWSWVRNPWFRLIHLIVICIVIVQSWFGAVCPLTTIEMALRTRAGDTVYTGSFIAHWLENILYYQAPPCFFIVCYLIVGALTCASWFWIRPRGFRHSASRQAS
jgi:hypothetical protein